MENLLDWIWFSRVKIGAIKKKKLLENFQNPKQIKLASKEQLLKIKNIGEESVKEILKIEYRKNLENYQNYMEKNKIKLLTIMDKQYPYMLKQIYDYPVILYAKGNIELLNTNSIAVIGTRKNTDYGRKITENFVEELVKEKITIVSGLAIGIDSYAHKTALKAKGNTVAVLGNGLDTIYPKENIKLSKQILEQGGAIISEYPLGTKVEKMNFPARNRIISGISKGVLVTEAKKKSGTMITVDFALEQGREVYTIPRKHY